MERTFRGALSRAAAHVISSRFAKPIARVALATAGLALLAFVGRTAVAGAVAVSAPQVTASASVVTAPPADPSHDTPPQVAPAGAASSALHSPRPGASPDDPVVLNAATETDFMRLPGIGAKRAGAIVALRTRLGRFRAVEDLLKVKGIGRATLKRMRPLLRLDPLAIDAGPPRPAGDSTSSPP